MRAILFTGAFVALLYGFPSGVGAQDELRPADTILRELRSVHFPRNSYGMTEEEFRSRIREASERQIALVEELNAHYPDHREIPRWMKARWDLLQTVFERADQVLTEAEEVLRTRPDHPLAVTALYQRARAHLGLDRTFDQKRRAIAQYTRQFPTSKLGAHLLMDLLEDHAPDQSARKEIADEIVGRYTDDELLPLADARKFLAQLERVGTEWSVEFTDHLSEREIRSRDLLGRFVLVLFWGGSASERELVRRIQEVETRYPSRLSVLGVVQLGYQGEERLQQFLEQTPVDWPQFDEFSTMGADGFDGFRNLCSVKAGVRRWPTVYLLDPAGKIAGVDVGKELETVVEAHVSRWAW